MRAVSDTLALKKRVSTKEMIAPFRGEPVSLDCQLVYYEHLFLASLHSDLFNRFVEKLPSK